MSTHVKPLGYINHQLNDSVAKAAFSFPRERRFNTPQQRRPNNDAMYFPPVELHSTKAISFGYGKKSDIARESDAPSPDRYNLKSDFEINRNANRKGFSFGVGREKTSFGDPMWMAKVKLPGVGAYTLDPAQFTKTNGGYIGGKLGSCFSQNKQLADVPGPGAYDMSAVEIHNSGSYVLSKFKNPELSNYRFRTEPVIEERSKEKDMLKKSIGPGTYREVDVFNPEGTYQVSGHESKKGWSFSKSRRRSITEGKEATPGPALYNKFSVFGE